MKFLLVLTIFITLTPIANAQNVQATFIYTTAAKNSVESIPNTTISSDAFEVESEFNDITSNNPGAENFTLDVENVFVADSTYVDVNNHVTVKSDAYAGNITVGGKSVKDIRHETGVDIVVIVTTAYGGPTSSFGVDGSANTSPTDETNYILTSRALQGTDPNARGNTVLHEVLHLLGEGNSQHGQMDCLLGGDPDMCQSELDAITNNGANMADYGATWAANNLPHQPELDGECLSQHDWIITFENSAGIFDVVMERRSGTLGPWNETWSGDNTTCVIRSGNFVYRAHYVDFYGNRGPYSTLVHAAYSCGNPN